MYSDNELKLLRDELENNLEEFQQIEIFKIIKKNDLKYTKNNNGIFLNMKFADENTIKEIKEYLSFININKLM